MSSTAELQPASQEHAVTRRENISGSPSPEQISEHGGGLLNHIFAASPGEPPSDSAARLLSSPALSHSANSPVRAITLKRAQQTHGNRVAQRAVAKVQRKVRPNQTIQRESVQAQVTDANESTILRSGNGDLVPSDSPGEPIDKGLRGSMEQRFGPDFGNVRIHTDEKAATSAEALNANAFTTGRDIYFAAGQYAPHSTEGQRLLAHELTHTIQQSKAQSPIATEMQTSEGTMVGSADDPLEREADRTADFVVGGSELLGDSASHLASGGIRFLQRQATPETDLIPTPVEVVWGGDPFTISFERKAEKGLDYFYFIVRYTGPHPADGPFVDNKTKRLRTDIGTGKLKVRVQSKTDSMLAIDLYGYGDSIVKLVDKVSVDPRPKMGREHDFSVKVLGEARVASSLWIKDPSAQPEKQSEQPTIQGDMPGEKPQSNLIIADLATEIRIDGDGDQLKELLLRIKPKSYWPDPTTKDRAKTVNLQITQLSSKESRQVDFDLPEPTIQGGLFPIVREVTDGKAPTKISLISPIDSQLLLVHPPTRTEKNVSYMAQVAGRSIIFNFPPEKSPIQKIASAEEPVYIGGIASIDITLGSYNDKFRITVQTTASTLKPSEPPQAVFGISALYRGKPVGGGMSGVIPKLTRTQYIRVLESDGTSMALDIDGDPQHVLHIYDQLTTPADYDGGGPPEKNRNHHVRVVGPEFGEKVFYFPVRSGYLSGGYANPSPADQKAESNALAVSGLREQAKEGSFEQQLDAYEGAMMAIRKKAADEHLIQQKTYDALVGLSTAMIKLRPQVSANKADSTKTVDSGLKVNAATQAKILYDSLADETKKKKEANYSLGGGSSNPYTGETTTIAGLYSHVDSGPGAGLPSAITLGQWDNAYAFYRSLVGGLDQWIVDRLKETKGEKSKEAQQAELINKRKSALGEIENKKPIAIHAVFHPDEKFKTEEGYVAEIPLALYAYKDGDTWYLKNLTNPDKAYHVTASPSASGEEPPIPLFSKLNDPDRFPVGRIHYQVPNSYGGQVKTTDYLTWKKFFTYLGLGLAAIGLTLATFGTGTVAVAGAWALAGSAIAGGIAAGIDLAEGIQQGDLTTTRVVINIAQIVASLTGVSALRAGRIMSGAMSAAKKGTPLIGRAKETAALYGKVYVVATGTRIAADVVTVAAFGVDVAQELDEIENGHGSPTDKDRAKWLLLSQLAVMGGLVTLSVKGEIPGLLKREAIVLENIGGVQVAYVGEGAVITHKTTPGAPATSFTLVKFKLQPAEQIQYLTSNLQGLTSEQAAFLLNAALKRGGTIVFGGSRVRGTSRLDDEGRVISDLDVGFENLTKGQINGIMNDFNKKFTGSSQGPVKIIEHNWIYPGSKPDQDIPQIISPEEFFMRSGARSPKDGPKAGQKFGPSGYIKVKPDGTIESGKPD